jgi:predicted nucleotidyltransferase
MTTKTRSKSKPRQKATKATPEQPTRWYRGADIPKSVIRRFAREVAEKFQPEKIILFGSHAYGRPHADSDVDILVIMPCRNELDQAFKISWATQPSFSLDIIVRKPHDMKWRLEEGDWFLRDIVSKGKVLYEAPDGRMGRKSGGRLSRGNNARRRKNASA